MNRVIAAGITRAMLVNENSMSRDGHDSESRNNETSNDKEQTKLQAMPLL